MMFFCALFHLWLYWTLKSWVLYRVFGLDRVLLRHPSGTMCRPPQIDRLTLYAKLVADHLALYLAHLRLSFRHNERMYPAQLKLCHDLGARGLFLSCSLKIMIHE